MENIQYPIEMVIPFFQTPNNIFDLDINIVGYKVDKVSKKIKKEIRVMKPHEKLVYIYLCRCGNNGGKAFPSYGTIARKCSISRRTAIDTIKILKDNKLIVKKSRTKENNVQNSNAYFVLPPSAGNAPGSECNAPGSECDALGGECDAPKKELIKKNYFKKNYLSNNKNNKGDNHNIDLTDIGKSESGENRKRGKSKSENPPLLSNEFNNNKKDIENPLIVYQNNIFPTPGVIDIESINSWTEKLGADIVIYAINIATKANARRLNYIEKILMDWERNGIITLEQAQSYTANRGKRKIISSSKSKKVDEFNNHPQRDYDFDALEKKLLGWQDQEE